MPTIRELRESRGWTQLELGNALGIRPETIMRWERGRHEPSRLAKAQIARVFRVKPEEIELVPKPDKGKREQAESGQVTE